MTIATTVTKVGYTGDGVTVAFAVPFPFFDNDELEVIERVIATGAETVKTLTTHYTVAGGNGATGTVTALVAPASTVQWHILRKTALVQETDYPENDPFPAESHERALDRLTAIVQEANEILARALKIPATDSTSINTTVSSSVERANKYQVWDANGAPALGVPPTVDNSGLLVVQGTDPGHVEGRMWIDTSAAPIWRFKLSKGGSWITINEVNTTNTPWFNGAVLGALAALGVGDGLEALSSLARIKLNNSSYNLIERSGDGIRGRLPRNYLYGLTLSNSVGDPDNDIVIAPGIYQSEDGTTDMVLASSLTKRLDATFSIGTNQGGYDVGTKTANTMVDCYLISNSTGSIVDAVFCLSGTNPTVPPSFSKKSLIGSVYVRSTGQIRPFIQRGRTFRYVGSTLDVEADITIGAVVTQGASIFLPSPRYSVEVLLGYNFIKTSGTVQTTAYFDETDINQTASPNATVFPMPDSITNSTALPSIGRSRVNSKPNGQIFYSVVTVPQTPNCLSNLKLCVHGWTDRIGA